MKNMMIVFVVTMFCISCSSSNMSVTANLPETQEVDIHNKTKDKQTN